MRNHMNLEQIKHGILVQIDKDLPVGKMELAVEDAGKYINARLTELCLHGTVEDDKEAGLAHTEVFTDNWSPGVRARGKMEVFLWLLPKWLRWRKPRFERVELATTVTHNDYFWKRTTYMPRPEVKSDRPSVTMAGNFDAFETRLMQDMMAGPPGIAAGDKPTFRLLSGIPVQMNPMMEDGLVLLMNPKTMSMIRRRI